MPRYTKEPRSCEKHAKLISLNEAYAKVSQQSEDNRRRQRQRRSAIRSLSRWTGIPEAGIPGNPEDLRKVFDQVRRSGVGIRPHTLANVKSVCLGMIAESSLVDGVQKRGTRQKPLSPLWFNYYERLDSRRLRTCLKRFIHYLCDAAITPQSVDDAVFSSYCQHIHQISLQANVERIFRDAALAWNDARALFPDLELAALLVPPSKRAKTLLGMEELAPTLQVETAQFLSLIHI